MIKREENKRYGKLVVQKQSGVDKWGSALWICNCDCGGSSIVRGSALRNNTIRSCRKCVNVTHGHTSSGINRASATYRSWRSMLNRCYNTEVKNYKYYGGKGVIVCSKWRNSFESFLDDMGERPTDTHLDRINPDDHYYKENCRWLSSKENLKHNPDLQSLVAAFHRKYNVKTPNYPMYASTEEAMLRVRLMTEELAEVVKAIASKDMVNLAKELADLLYVVFGTGVLYGIPLTKVFYAVHMSNMTKTPAKDVGGKVQKGPDYEPPNIEKVLTNG